MSSILILIGPSGSGKTAVASQFAKKHGYAVVDPQAVFQRDGASETSAFVQDPDAASEKLIEASIDALTDAPEKTVIELPPSAPLNPEVSAKMRGLRAGGAKVVFLDANLDALSRRSGLNAPQLGFLGTPRAWFRELYQALIQGYEGQFDLYCDTTHADPGSVADLITREAKIN